VAAAAAADKPAGFAVQLAGLFAGLIKGVRRGAADMWPAAAAAVAAVADTSAAAGTPAAAAAGGATTQDRDVVFAQTLEAEPDVKLMAAMVVSQAVQQAADSIAAEQTRKGMAVAPQWILLSAQAGKCTSAVES
jgi:hypothetical protein